ncbi:hypothetical protein PASLES1_05370 [Pseudomonas aeruginosa]
MILFAAPFPGAALLPRRNAFLAEMHKRADKVPEKTVKTL